MRKRTVIAAAGLILAACGAEPAPPTSTITVEDARPNPADVTDEEIAKAVSTSLDSAMELSRWTGSDDGNTVISPAALSYLLAIAHAGASCEAADEITAFIGGNPDTYRYLAAALGGAKDDHYQTRLTGLVLHAASGRGDEEALEDAAARYGTAYGSVPQGELTGVADGWLSESTNGRAAHVPMPLVAGADAAILTAAHHETVWTGEASAITTEFEFFDGRVELVPALDVGVADVWETDSGMVIKLPTASADPTYAYYPDKGTELADLTASDWQTSGEPAQAELVLPAVSTSSSIDIDSHRSVAGLTGLAEGGECGLSGFGPMAGIDFGSGYAAYEITVDGISAGDGIELPDEASPDATIVENAITIDRPFALLTTDGETGWAITYAIINDPTR